MATAILRLPPPLPGLNHTTTSCPRVSLRFTRGYIPEPLRGRNQPAHIRHCNVIYKYKRP